MIYTVSQISKKIQDVIKHEFLSIEIKGEISGYKKHSSGHMYFSLKDKNAVINGICWRGTKLDIELKDGIEVIVHGKLTTYPMRSNYQIIIDKVRQEGIGNLQQLLKERYEKFKKKGYFDLERKKSLPKYPFRIGIVTSETGSVIKDILHRITERFPCHLYLWPVLVQGIGADKQIAHAIAGFNSHINADLIIVARGGGSLEDLWSFNEEIVVEAVFKSKIPIISGIGHETDSTLIDFVADKRAPTPTGAAEISVPVKSDVFFNLIQYKKNLIKNILNLIRMQEIHIKKATIQIPRIEEKIIKVDDLSERFFNSITNYFKIQLSKIEKIYLEPPKIDIYISKLKLIYEKFSHSSKTLLKNWEHIISSFDKYLDNLDIQKTLKRGYCISLNNSNILKKSDVERLDSFQLKFFDGKISINKK